MSHGTWFMRKSWDKKELGLVQLFRQQGLQSWANDKDTQRGGGGWLAGTELHEPCSHRAVFSKCTSSGCDHFLSDTSSNGDM